MLSKNGRPLCWDCGTEIESIHMECKGCEKELDPKEKIGMDPDLCQSCRSNLCDGICINGCHTKMMEAEEVAVELEIAS